jgi:PIN domain nuclease of toxin-antitoxin system
MAAYLLDTCAASWWWTDASELSRKAHRILAEPDNEIVFSAVSAMEIATKQRLGKLILKNRPAADLHGVVIDSGWCTLDLSITAAQLGGQLDWAHRDPFDRLLAAQAMTYDLRLVTCDPVFSSLPKLRIVW